MLNLLVSARRRPVVCGVEQMIGATGEVLDGAVGATYAQVRGEIWKVRSGASLTGGERVRVVGIEGLALSVEPVQQGDER
jgi:membrane-bound serine protease (ClpP class)